MHILFVGSNKFEFFVQNFIFRRTNNFGSKCFQAKQKHIWSTDWQKARLFYRRYEHASSGYIWHTAANSVLKTLLRVWRDVRSC